MPALQPKEVKVSPYDTRQLEALAIGAVELFMMYGGPTTYIERALVEAFQLGFTAVSRGEADGQFHPPLPDWMREDVGFVEGDAVTWESQARGFTSTKVGTVAAVVSAGFRPDKIRFPSMYKGKGSDPGLPRDAPSYVVAVKKPQSTKYYWPIATNLKRA